ncbi:hypothetical protein [Clostridium sp.]|jgi:hypothetical protein|uniref:hypothetical protein n=1 Tax=Clostridium sp. TaxID=1506 RepID=UPI0039F63406
MKVFTVRKEEEDLIDKSKDRTSYIKLNKKEKFNYIIIKNPSNSNEICTIKTMKIFIKDEDNELCLMHGEELFRGEEDSECTNKIGIFNIKTRMQKYKDNKKVELIRKKLLRNEECDILKDSVLIMLPNGCLFIRLNNEVSNLNISIDWTSEKIY